MTEERKNEIGKVFLLSNEMSIEELKNIDIQEIIFLIYSAQHFKNNSKFPNINFDKKIQVFYRILKDKIKNIGEFYIAYDKNTNYPYADSEGRAWIFSKKEYADKAEDYFRQQLIMLKMKRISKVEVISEFVNLHRIGIKKVLVDNGEYTAEVNRDDIFSTWDLSGVSGINMSIINPALQCAAIKFFQKLYSKSNYDGKNKELNRLQEDMFKQVITARYLVPTQLKEKEQSYTDDDGATSVKVDSVAEFARLMDKNNKIWIPVFTDRAEFEQAYDKNEWNTNTVTYDDLLALSKDMEGIVVNCDGICLRIDEKTKAAIEKYRDKENTFMPTSLGNGSAKKDTKITLEEPEEYPTEMIKDIKKYMKKEKDIYEAYLRIMLSNDKKSYLIIVDFDDDDNKNEIFKEIEEVALPHLEEMCLDVMEMDDWTEGAVKEVEPFYRRKRFGIF